MSASVRSLKYLLGWLIAGTRGGLTRAEMIRVLKETPQNATMEENYALFEEILNRIWKKEKRERNK
jgi:IS1 family transposase